MEHAHLSVKNDGQFFMYQIIGISLVHKNKHQSNQGYRKKNVAKNNFDESIPRHKRFICELLKKICLKIKSKHRYHMNNL